MAIQPYPLKVADGKQYCCGVSEIYGITNYYSEEFTPESAVMAVAWSLRSVARRGAFLFEDINAPTESSKVVGLRVKKLADYILQHGLGTPVVCPTTLNPNSSNLMTVLVWVVNYEAVEKWLIQADKDVKKDDWTWANVRRNSVTGQTVHELRRVRGG